MKSLTIATILAIASFTLAIPPFDPAGAAHVGNGQGQQFITGQCLSDADCASGCCANPTGICSGPGAAFQQGKEGCGFGGGAGGKKAGRVPPSPAASASFEPRRGSRSET